MGPQLYIDCRMRNHSGIGTYIRNVAGRVVRDLPAERFTLVGSEPEKDAAVPAHRFIRSTSAIYSVSEQLSPLRYGVSRGDVFWSPHYNMPLLLRCRHLVTVHDLLHLAMPEFAGGFAKQTYAKLFFSQVASRAEKVICVSRATADELIRFTGIEPGKIEVIHNGVDAFWQQPTALPRPLPDPYFLFVGNVKPHKNLRRLIAAMRLFAEEKRDYQLVIVGKREGFISGDSSVFEDAASMPGKVTFTGYVEDDVLKSYIQHAEALIFPSLYEGFGLPPLEAMACGCPVIVSDIQVHREICGRAAVFADPYSIPDLREKMKHVAGLGSAARAELVAAGREQAARFSWKRAAGETLAVIKGALER